MNTQNMTSKQVLRAEGDNLRRKLLSDNWYFNLTFFLLLIAAASLPFTTWLMPIIAGLMLIVWIAEWNWKEKWQNIRKNASIYTIVVFFAIYLILIYGFFLSYNKGRAFAAFDCGMWFLAAPLLLFTRNRKNLTNSRIHMIFMVFAISTFVHLFILFSIATHKFIQTGKSHYFYYQYLSIWLHPSYLAMYATFSFYFLLDFLNKTHKMMSWIQRLSLYFVQAVLLFGVFFLQSKAGIIVFCILAIIWFVYLLFIRNTDIALALSIIVSVSCICIVLHETQIFPTNRFKATIEDVSKYRNEQNHGTSSSELRLTAWRSTLEICKKNLPWGVGTGDVIDELSLNAVKKNHTNLIGYHLNSHNQYLQTLLALGIPGILVLIAYCIHPLIVGGRKKNLLYISFAIILILNIGVESMFDVRAGVDFIALMNVLLLMRTT